MTREDIEDIVKIICPDDEDFEKPCISPMYLRKELETLALEQEPCEDAISRKAVMNCFKKWQPYMATRLFDFEKELSSLPPVNPQPKTGHWIDMDEGFSPYECSECKSVEFKKSKYCPNCGARNGGE